MVVALGKGRVESKLVEHMSVSGFRLIRKEPLYEHPTGRFLYHEDEMVFNRGLDSKISNFCVFAKTEQDGSVTIQYYNPDPTGIKLGPYSIHRKIRLPSTADDPEILAAVMRILRDSAKKKESSFFLNLHEHFGSLSPPYYGRDGERIKPGMVDYDDGVSFLTDNIRKSLYYHIDYSALSCHNSVVREPFTIVSLASQAFGFVAVPAVEITASFGQSGPHINGPHFVVIGRNRKALKLVRKAILDMGERGDMPAYFSGMEFEDIMSILFRLQKINQIAICIAHPFNFNTPTLPVPLVGLYSAVEAGALTLDMAHEYASKCDSVAMWNTSLYAKTRELEVQDAELRYFLQHVSRKHTGTKRLFVNQVNFALAQELHERFGLHTHFETDEHKTLPLIESEHGGYAVGGDSLGMGATVVEVPAETFAKMEKNPSVGELIDALRSKALQMTGRVFATKKHGMAVKAERTRIPDELKHMARKYQHALSRRYAGMLVKDFFEFLIEGDVKKIIDMTGD